MAVKLHLTSGEEYLVEVNEANTESLLKLMNEHGVDGGYLTFSDGSKKDTIIIRHIVKISEY